MTSLTLRIGVNLLYLRPGRVGGSEVYCRSVVEQLAAREDAEVTLFCSQESMATFDDARLNLVDASSGPYRHVQRIRDENFGLLRHLETHPVDVLWSPSNFAAPLLPHRIRQVITVHDLQHHWLPAHFPLPTRLQRTALFAASFLRARRIIAISEFSRQDVMRRYRVPGRRIVTVLEGVSERVPCDARSAQATVDRLGLPTPFFYYPAADHAHKNHRGLVESFARFLERSGMDMHLVLSGARGDVYDRAARRAAAYAIDGRVHHLGFLERRDDVFALLKASSALVFPSEFEGFGLPPIEAQKVGTPVIASNRASIPEVVGDGGLLLDPMDTEGWARAMERIVTDDELRHTLVQKGHQNVARFSWKRCADESFQVLASAARAPDS